MPNPTATLKEMSERLDLAIDELLTSWAHVQDWLENTIQETARILYTIEQETQQ